MVNKKIEFILINMINLGIIIKILIIIILLILLLYNYTIIYNLYIKFILSYFIFKLSIFRKSKLFF